MCRSHSVSGFLSKVAALCVAVYSVHLYEEGSGAFCVTIWVNLQHILFLIVSIFGWPLQDLSFTHAGGLLQYSPDGFARFFFCLFIVYSQPSSHSDSFTNKSF